MPLAGRPQPRGRREVVPLRLFRRSGESDWDELDESLRELFLADEAGFRGELKAAPHQANGDLAHISAGEAAASSVPMSHLLAGDSHQGFHNSHAYLTNAARQTRTIKLPGACHLIPIQQPEPSLPPSAARARVRRPISDRGCRGW
jgi:hypothetical protein